MSTSRLLRLIARTGRVAEPLGPATDNDLQVRAGFEPPRALRGSVQVRHVDAGSCNGCELEIGAAFGPVYDAERIGARLVASPGTPTSSPSPVSSHRTWPSPWSTP